MSEVVFKGRQLRDRHMRRLGGILTDEWIVVVRVIIELRIVDRDELR